MELRLVNLTFHFLFTDMSCGIKILSNTETAAE